jgi:UDP:flavonoid glycosyltransferase YjiC (YdhE family)
MRSALRSVIDDAGYRRRAQAIAARTAKDDAAATGADLVEAVVDSRRR